jgi:hypothetical protein
MDCQVGKFHIERKDIKRITRTEWTGGGAVLGGFALGLEVVILHITQYSTTMMIIVVPSETHHRIIVESENRLCFGVCEFKFGGLLLFYKREALVTQLRVTNNSLVWLKLVRGVKWHCLRMVM